MRKTAAAHVARNVLEGTYLLMKTVTKDLTETVGSAGRVSKSGGRQKLVITKKDPIERDVKERVKQIIDELAPKSHRFMPVQTGFGSPDLDFIVTVNGYALRIETKVDGKKPSARQLRTINDLVEAGAFVLVIDQNNLVDVAIVVEYLLTDSPVIARGFADASRREYCDR